MEGRDFMREKTSANDGGTDGVLLMLFDRLVREHGPVKAGDMLGINYRTVARVRTTRQLTPYVTNALEMYMLSEANPVIAGLATKVDELRGHVESLRLRDKDLATAVETIQTESKASLESLVEMVRSTERKVEKLSTSEKEAARSAVRTADGKKTESSKHASKEEPPKKTTWFPRRTYPELVTKEPAEDDEYVYKEALPAVQEWRELSRGHPVKGKTLSWMKRQERMLEVEQRLLDEFQLTLPPDRRPLTKEWRKKQLRWHDEDLRSIRGRIVRRLMLRWVRRILTLGLWRK